VKNFLRILFVALLIGLVGYLMQVPDLEERYATAGEANFGVSMKSWVRDWMPPAARNITAATDMDVPAQDGAKPRHVYYRCDRQFVALSATEAYVWLP
jgi:hypothetical protein